MTGTYALSLPERDPAGPTGSAAGDWSLFLDWCTATGRDPAGSGWGDLAAFLSDMPASEVVLERRLRSVRPMLGLGRGGLPRPVTGLRSRVGPRWASYADALGALRHEWWPEGIAARRDALVIVLVAHGLTRARLSRLRPAGVTVFPEAVVDDLRLAGHRDPALCPRCALVRWLKVLDAYRDRSGRDIEFLLTDARSAGRPRHDCHDLVGEGWRTVPRLLPPIDQHGALRLGAPISARALTGILARRFTITPTVAKPSLPHQHPPARTSPGTRPTPQEHEEIGRLYGRIDQEADALNARIQALLDGTRSVSKAGP